MLIRDEHRASQAPPPAAPTRLDELRAAALTQLKRVRRLKLNVGAWALGTILLTTLWVLNEWQANGAFERFGHEGDPGDWNPTLWAIAIGVWGVIGGVMGARVYFEAPVAEAEVGREVGRLKPSLAARDAPTDAELWRFTRVRLERIRRLKFH